MPRAISQTVFSSFNEFDRNLKELEEETASQYITHKKQADFGKANVQPSVKKTTYWKLKYVEYDGVPFQLVGTKVYGCHLGKDRNVRQKEKYQAKKQQQAIAEDTKQSRDLASAALKAALAKTPSEVEAIVEYHTCFPTIDDHQNHPTVGQVAELRESVDDRVSDKIKSLILAGARKVCEIKRHVRTFVNDELFRGQPPPSSSRRKYFPTDRDIWNIMGQTRDSTRNTQQDQANLQILCDRWSTQEDCTIKFRPSELHEDGTTTKMLFCYQTAWQRVFVPHSERTEDIREALQVFKAWNPEWHPSHFMVDFCEAEIGALEAEFQDSEVLLCDFHREKAWVEWVRKKDHGVSDVQDTVLELLRDVASAATLEEYEESLSRLHDSSVWQENEKLRTWLNNKWLKDTCPRRWVQAFKDENLKVAIYTNNGVERQNETLKYSHLDGSKTRSLSDMLTTVVTDFLPTAHRKYIQLNVTFSSCYRKYHESLPPFLKDRPRGVVTHIMSRLSEAQCYEESDILPIGPGIFRVKSASSQSQHHTVNFEPSTNNMPSFTITTPIGIIITTPISANVL
ncbi:CARF [Branchiostoma lanceolatum]|uniref:CARF protein n=1 Tax=Branchiostoma lanceolatum TaxID=7740 RepID=A0A8J9Z4E6_BRALA|nr:CARF [Branchiostoma lanceolatum]